MNWTEGIALDKWVNGHPGRHVDASLAILGLIADAVDYLHSGVDTGIPVIHRDINPFNILINEHKIKLVDFGFARMMDEGSMTFVGTPDYLAPEVMLHQASFSPMTDRYAFGVTTFFTLTGTSPAGLDVASRRARLARAFGCRLSAQVVDEALRMIDPVPGARPPKATAWIQSLANYKNTGRPATEPEHPFNPPMAPSPQHFPDFVPPDESQPLPAAPARTPIPEQPPKNPVPADPAPAAPGPPTPRRRHEPAGPEALRTEGYRLALLLTAGDQDWSAWATRKAMRRRPSGASINALTWPEVRDRIVREVLYPDRRRGRRRSKEESLMPTDVMWTALQQLPIRRRVVVILHQYEGLSDQQIADMLAMSVRKVTAELSRGRESLGGRAALYDA